MPRRVWQSRTTTFNMPMTSFNRVVRCQMTACSVRTVCLSLTDCSNDTASNLSHQRAQLSGIDGHATGDRTTQLDTG